MGVARFDWRCPSRMVGRDRVSHRRFRSRAYGLEYGEKLLGCFHRCAKYHGPQGNINLESKPHCYVPQFATIQALEPLCVKCGSQLPKWLPHLT
jgi:hypothetical protein